MPGKYFDEWTLGDKVTHGISRTVTEIEHLATSVVAEVA